MRLPHRLILLGLLSILLAVPAAAQKPLGLNDPLPYDPAVIRGTLPNGMKYYIRKNEKPDDRAELRLAVRAGSVLEDEDQLGLAHFVEHMAFNGTEHFPKNRLVTFLESIGMRFGADLNAYTSFDETVYMLQVPTEDEALDSGMMILKDWAGGVLFNDADIDGERGVVTEEWRLSQGGDSRVGDVLFEKQFAGAQYATRQPIGKVEIIQGADYDAFRRFYRDWYRPDLMAVVAVGDFDTEEMEDRIKKLFGALSNPKNPRTRTDYGVPVQSGTHVAVASDPEASWPSIEISVNLGPGAVSKTVGEYRQVLVDGLVTDMLNQRFSEIARQSNAPFLFASSYTTRRGLGATRSFGVSARPNDGQYLQTLRTMLTELERVRQHGFTQAELDRAVKGTIRFFSQTLAEKDKTESRAYAREYVSNHTTGESFPGIEFEHRIAAELLPKVTIDEVNRLAREIMVEEGRFIGAGGPEKEGLKPPTEAEIRVVLDEVKRAKVAPYVEEAIASSLMEKKPKAGSITSTKTIEEIGVTEWTLSNGVRVVLKPTDFRNDEIQMSAYSPGGTSLVSEADYIAASTASGIVQQSGLGPFDRNALDKFMTGRVVGVGPGISELFETIGGRASKEDLETMFQMTHLYFTAPRRDESAFETFRAQQAAMMETQGIEPQQVFLDSVRWFSAGYHPRRKPWTPEILPQLNLDKSFQIYRDRFGDAGDFTFFFVGSFKPEELRPYVETYLASLPASGRKESWRDLNIETPTGVHRKEFHKGTDPKSIVYMVWHGDFEWSRENRYRLTALGEVLRLMLTERLREEKGGVYSPGARTSSGQFPEPEYSITVSFSCDPNRAQELIDEVNKIVGELKDEVDEAYVQRFDEIQRREIEVRLKENNFWMSGLQWAYQNNFDPRTILKYQELFNMLNTELVEEAAEEFFNDKNRATFILYPEAGTGEPSGS